MWRTPTPDAGELGGWRGARAFAAWHVAWTAGLAGLDYPLLVAAAIKGARPTGVVARAA
jgi:hypothetical protein